LIGDAELEDGKKAAKIMEGVLQRGDKGYQEARQKIIDGLKAQGSLAAQQQNFGAKGKGKPPLFMDNDGKGKWSPAYWPNKEQGSPMQRMIEQVMENDNKDDKKEAAEQRVTIMVSDDNVNLVSDDDDSMDEEGSFVIEKKDENKDDKKDDKKDEDLVSLMFSESYDLNYPCESYDL